jgi:hypothetical protein
LELTSLIQRLIDELLSNFTLQVVQILLLRLLHQIRTQSILHLGQLTPYKLLQLPQLLLRQFLKIELVLFGTAIEDDVSHALNVLLSQPMDVESQLSFFLSRHGQ